MENVRFLLYDSECTIEQYTLLDCRMRKNFHQAHEKNSKWETSSEVMYEIRSPQEF